MRIPSTSALLLASMGLSSSSLSALAAPVPQSPLSSSVAPPSTPEPSASPFMASSPAFASPTPLPPHATARARRTVQRKRYMGLGLSSFAEREDPPPADEAFSDSNSVGGIQMGLPAFVEGEELEPGVDIPGLAAMHAAVAQPSSAAAPEQDDADLASAATPPESHPASTAAPDTPASPDGQTTAAPCMEDLTQAQAPPAATTVTELQTVTVTLPPTTASPTDDAAPPSVTAAPPPTTTHDSAPAPAPTDGSGPLPDDIDAAAKTSSLAQALMPSATPGANPDAEDAIPADGGIAINELNVLHPMPIQRR